MSTASFLKHKMSQQLIKTPKDVYRKQYGDILDIYESKYLTFTVCMLCKQKQKLTPDKLENVKVYFESCDDLHCTIRHNIKHSMFL